MVDMGTVARFCKNQVFKIKTVLPRMSANFPLTGANLVNFYDVFWQELRIKTE